MELSLSHDPGCSFDRLTQVELSCLFFLSLFLINFFSISSFNISLIGNQISYLILICFLCSYSSLIIRVTDLTSWPGSIQYIFISMFFFLKKKHVNLNYFRGQIMFLTVFQGSFESVKLIETYRVIFYTI